VSEALLRRYYDCFNGRRAGEAVALFAEDALLEHIPFGEQHIGGAGYLRFAEAWCAAFPDATLTIERIQRRGDTMFDVDLVSCGTHAGLLDIGTFQFRPSGRKATLRLRELVEIRDGKIVSSSLSLDLRDLINQLSIVDYGELLARLECLRTLTDELVAACGDAARQRDLAERIGGELDAARRALRPHYKR
jgi:predicted ester cyclase